MSHRVPRRPGLKNFAEAAAAVAGSTSKDFVEGAHDREHAGVERAETSKWSITSGHTTARRLDLGVMSRPLGSTSTIAGRAG